MAEPRLERVLGQWDVQVESRELMHEFWYRPTYVLVAAGDAERLGERLDAWECQPVGADHPDPWTQARVRRAEALGFTLLAADWRMSVPATISHLTPVPSGPAPRISPVHVFFAEQRFGGVGIGTLEPIEEPSRWPGDDVDGDTGRDVTIGILDTGVSPHPRLQDRLVDAEGQDEQLDVEPPNGELDDLAGHGTFVAGVAHARAPGAAIKVVRTLNSLGYADELEIASGIAALADCDVINLSLGAYTETDFEPMAVHAALDALPRTTAVVASAGNYSKQRPLWPAASKRVLSVAAHDGGEQPKRAPFSNFGPWVDACASGVDVVSTFIAFGEGSRQFDGWARWSGSSFAAPRVAGEIAARMSADGVDAAEAAHRLLRDTDRPRLPLMGAVFS